MLYAGTTSIFSLNYSILNNIVKIFKQWSISAGNIYTYVCGTSETLRNETVMNKENVKSVSVHVSKHLKPLNDNQFGYYLAGLIDGDSNFSSKQQLVIVFHSSDVSLAYYIKKQIGFGTVKKVKNKNAYILILSSKEGIEKVINLINGKIRTNNKFSQINKNILNNNKYVELKNVINFKLNTDNFLENHWLAGFSDADSSFQINILKRINRTEVRLNFQIDQKEDYLLKLIKNYFGGNIGYRKSQNTYYYESTSAKNVINYFDKYHLLSSKHINFLKWRKAYIIVQNKDHLNEEGLNKIVKLKSTMNSAKDITV